MKSSIETTKITTLPLNEHEVDWLKALVQNPYGYEDPRDEPKENSDMRYALWNALTQETTFGSDEP